MSVNKYIFKDKYITYDKEKEEGNCLLVAHKLKSEILYIDNEYFDEDADFINDILQENKQLKEDLEYVLNQTLGAFSENWCIDWNFTDIREKYGLGGADK